MREALFYNFTDKAFTGYWDGKGKTFKPGAKMYMEEWRARHYAKHLVNRVLIEAGKDNYTSPKFPDQVPEFKVLFDQACIIDEEQGEQDGADIIDAQHGEPSMNVPGKNQKVPTIVDDKEPQIIKSPDDDDDDDFEGLND